MGAGTKGEFRRFPCQIIQRILQLAAEGESKTRIMYGANLSHALLVRYLGFLESRGYIVAAGGQYVVTDKGRAFQRDLGPVVRALEPRHEEASLGLGLRRAPARLPEAELLAR